ncbi:3-dehydroquinate synthase [uncultured Mesonia sp.]|uniref:3-dehydroquinate synthase n=1 Tax=uncultured Mesonia sp. TaxID=399731 RepID=UPI00374E79C5
MKAIPSVNNTVYFVEEAYQKLNDCLATNCFSKVFILVDTQTQINCLPQFLPLLQTNITIEVIEIDSGEQNKNLQTCKGVWEALADLGADRKSILINLGGGVVTDLGGFVASTYQRGIAYINIPTSLLAMVDASIGGKTGIDLGNLKNQIGVINDAKMVLIDPKFLATLPANQMRSGLAEMLKHGLIADKNYWKKMTDLSQLNLTHLNELIYRSIEIKNKIITEDLFEDGIRKTLNFGHTLGHAIEAHYLNQPNENVLHGEAVAAGMIMAAFLSHKLTQFPKEDLEELSKVIKKYYGTLSIKEEDVPEILDLLKHDKKNSHGKVLFVLLSQIAQPQIDCKIPKNLLKEAFTFYLQV